MFPVFIPLMMYTGVSQLFAYHSYEVNNFHILPNVFYFVKMSDFFVTVLFQLQEASQNLFIS
jgi:hypothetical protein